MHPPLGEGGQKVRPPLGKEGGEVHLHFGHPRTQGAALLASYPPRHRPGFEERLAAWQELQQAGVPLPKTASGRTRPMAAKQLEATFERMHEAGEAQQLKLNYKQREQRRSQNKERSRPQSAQVRTACVHRLYTEDCANRELLHAQRAERVDLEGRAHAAHHGQNSSVAGDTVITGIDLHLARLQRAMCECSST